MTLILSHRERTNFYNSRTLYTDGSYDNGVAGWAVVEGETCIYQDWGLGIHSNLAEGLGILSALKILDGESGVIYSDSLCWVNAVNKRGKMKGEKSKVVLNESLDLLSSDIEVIWVPGHLGIPGNELVDSYAKEARTSKVSNPVYLQPCFPNI